MTVVPSAGTRPRRDVQRNLAALLDAAKVVFASSGVDAPAKQITDLAGVGVGTLYRHFPRRSDLIVAVLRREIEACVRATERFGSTREPRAALQASVARFVELVRTKQGLADALHSTDPAYRGLPEALLDDLEPAVERVLERGRAEGSIGSKVRAREVLLGVALLCQPVPGEDDDLAQRLVQIFIDGVTGTPRR